MDPTKQPTPHCFKCEVCKRNVRRPGHLILRTPVCYRCRAEQPKK